ncbi:DISARM system phospholipase D-like protein DrmC [Nonomuraea sp. NPDC001684]
MVSSTTSADGDAAAELGRLLSGSQARELADRLVHGETLTMALRAVPPGLRLSIRPLLEQLAGGVVPILRAIEGSRSHSTALDPLWTMPGGLAQAGRLTSSIPRLVDSARQSVTCSTFNFQRSSALWDALAAAARRPEIELRVYIDTRAAQSPSAEEIAAHLRGGVVMRTREFDGRYVRNHAKLLVVDHRFLITTSANFSWSAERDNVEFGLWIDDATLAESIERELRRVADRLFERIDA